MRESLRRALSVVMVFAVVGAGTVAMVNLDQGPEPVDQYGPVQEGDALAVTAGTVLAVGAAFAIGAGVGALATDSGVNETKLDNADDAETYAYLHGQAASLGQTNEQFSDGVNNTADGLTTLLTVDGKTEYISELENGSSLPSKSVAKQAAIEKIENEATKREITFLNKYQQITAETFHAHKNLNNETNLSYSSSVVQPNTGSGWKTFNDVFDFSSTRNVTVTLTNGTSHNVETMGHIVDDKVLMPFDPGQKGQIDAGIRYSGQGEFSTVTIMERGEWPANWQNLQDSISEAKTQVSNYVDSTYSNYQQGDINQSDLIDPYVAARNYAPEGDNGAFTRRALTRMGYSVPDNVGEMRDMEIVADGQNLTGVLLTENAPNQELDVGKTYNVSNLPGTQYVQTDSEMDEVEDSLRIKAVYDTDGDRLNQSSVNYPEQNWDTTSIEGFKSYLDQQQEIIADLNARQDRLRNTSSGTGDIWPDLGGLPYDGAGVVVVVLSLLGLAAVSRSN